MSTISQVSTATASASASSTAPIEDEAGLQAAFAVNMIQQCYQFQKNLPGNADVSSLVSQLIEASKNGSSNDADPAADDYNGM